MKILFENEGMQYFIERECFGKFLEKGDSYKKTSSIKLFYYN